MKKLMIALAGLAMAVSAQAANADWGIMASADAEGCTVYVCSGIVQFKSASEIAALVWGTEFNSGTIDSGMAMNTVSGIADSEVGTDKTFYFVCVNSDNTGYWTATGTGDIYTTSTEPTMAYGDGSGWTDSNWTKWYEEPGPGPEPTPEPTSAMLMLLGMAGLALKRKRA